MNGEHCYLVGAILVVLLTLGAVHLLTVLVDPNETRHPEE